MSTTLGNPGTLQREQGLTIRATDLEVREESWVGDYGTCLAQRPARGSQLADNPELLVVEATVTKLKGGLGRLRVVSATDEENTESGDSKKPTYEIYDVEEERSIKRHPRYRAGGAKPITDPADWARIREWEAADTSAKQAAAFAAASANAQDLIAKLRLGQDSYRDYLPVAVIVSRHMAKGQARVCGKRLSAKPFSTCPDGYTWIRTGDRWTRTGKSGRWVRTQTFSGYKYVDPDLYEAES